MQFYKRKKKTGQFKEVYTSPWVSRLKKFKVCEYAAGTASNSTYAHPLPLMKQCCTVFICIANDALTLASHESNPDSEQRQW